MIFLTVGTLFPFDRLVMAVDEAAGKGLIKEEVFAQIGKKSSEPKHIKYAHVLDKEDFDDKVRQASCMISHAGMGSITMALIHNKPLLVMPRLKRFGEHVNDHQVGTAKKFEELGHVVVAYREEDLPDKIESLRTFVPESRENQALEVTAKIKQFLDSLQGQEKN